MFYIADFVKYIKCHIKIAIIRKTLQGMWFIQGQPICTIDSESFGDSKFNRKLLVFRWLFNGTISIRNM